MLCDGAFNTKTMILKTETGRELEVSEVDRDNEICIEIEGTGFEPNSMIWITIPQTLELIEFLKEQVSSFNSSGR
jgi:hypothetical protein